MHLSLFVFQLVPNPKSPNIGTYLIFKTTQNGIIARNNMHLFTEMHTTHIQEIQFLQNLK